jgi:AraC-like DNA-binding protein
MISVDELLDGVEVAIEPFGRTDAATVRYSDGGLGILDLVGGASVRCSAQQVIVHPPRGASGDDAFRARAADLCLARGRIRVTYHGAVGLFDALREPLVEALPAKDPIRAAFEDVLDELLSPRPGMRAMAEALLRRWLILLLRRYCEHVDHPPLWLAPFEDARLGRVVAAMQSRPEESFTVPRLAQVAGMSRSVFSARFADAVGQSPIEFLKTLRLERAAQLLSATDLPIKGVATRVGYASRSAFTRAFFATHGLAPAAFRSASREPLARRSAA